MEILLWLVPAALTTVVAMTAVAWWGREGRGEVDRETAARRLGEALARERGGRPGYATTRVTSTTSGVAVRTPRPDPGAPASPEVTVEVTVEERVEKPVEKRAETRVEKAPRVVPTAADDEQRRAS